MPRPTCTQNESWEPSTWNAFVKSATRPATKPPEAISRMPELSPPLLPAALPTFRISAAATPSGYARSLCTTIARRSGIVKSTPRQPPQADTMSVCQNSKPCQ